MRILRFLLPAILFGVIGLFLYKGLDRNPRDLPSVLIGKPAPAFSLPVLGRPDDRWSSESMLGKVWLLNVWGSWCAACQIEHPQIIELARTGSVPIVGLAWKDKPDASSAWLKRFGNPYTHVVSDVDGRVGIDWGVYGAPETFVIDRKGTVRFKHVGPITEELLRSRLLPLVRELGAAS
jgi:cytochrome c biogenesis protein CcmG, thiol:disulfide interchange protein DsbE